MFEFFVDIAVEIASTFYNPDPDKAIREAAQVNKSSWSWVKYILWALIIFLLAFWIF